MKRCRQALGFGEDGIGGFGPDERFGIIVVVLEVAVDGSLQVGHGAEDAAPQAAPGQGREERLNGVELRTGGRCESARSTRPAGV